MEFIISAATDIGIKKKINQDSFFIEKFRPKEGETAVLAVVCDGVSGTNHGEKASRSVTDGFSEWATRNLPLLLHEGIEDHIIREQWTGLIRQRCAEIYRAGLEGGYTSGTTATALLVTPKRYFLLNVGDTRAYELSGGVRQLTTDHTVAQEEISRGNITPEQAESSPIKSVLTRCIGAVPDVRADFFFGDTKLGAVYVLCCDGFRHKLSEKELFECFMANKESAEKLRECEEYLIELSKRRGEKDNITVAAVAVN